VFQPLTPLQSLCIRVIGSGGVVWLTALYKSFICLFLSGHNSISEFFLVTLQAGLTISPKGRCDFCHNSNRFSSLWAKCQSQDLIINYFLQCEEERDSWSWLWFFAKLYRLSEGGLSVSGVSLPCFSDRWVTSIYIFPDFFLLLRQSQITRALLSSTCSYWFLRWPGASKWEDDACWLIQCLSQVMLKWPGDVPHERKLFLSGRKKQNKNKTQTGSIQISVLFYLPPFGAFLKILSMAHFMLWMDWLYELQMVCYQHQKVACSAFWLDKCYWKEMVGVVLMSWFSFSVIVTYTAVNTGCRCLCHPEIISINYRTKCRIVGS
jgi:hypothetical protein